jgi:hypothetical protein
VIWTRMNTGETGPSFRKQNQSLKFPSAPTPFSTQKLDQGVSCAVCALQRHMYSHWTEQVGVKGITPVSKNYLLCEVS